MNVGLLVQLSSCCKQQLPQLLRTQPLPQLLVQQQRNLNANRAAITRVKRERYQRLYPITLVQPDGSTIQVKYPEPRILLRLPINLETATPEEKRKVTFLRSPKQTLNVSEDIGDDFDPTKYLQF